MRRRFLCVCCGLWSSLIGCGQPAGSLRVESEQRLKPLDPLVVAAATEPSWETQIEAVRSGGSSKIQWSGQVTPLQWEQLGTGCEGLFVLSLPEAQIGDSQLAMLSKLTSLRQVVLGGPITDEGLALLVQSPSLEIVNLPRGRFTDDGLKLLQQLPLLTLLRFGSPAVTDAGLGHLAGMSNLRFLHLLDVPITDAGLDQIKHCQLLESFYLDGGRCTDEGLSCLLRSQPGLHLHVNQLHLAGDEHADDH